MFHSQIFFRCECSSSRLGTFGLCTAQPLSVLCRRWWGHTGVTTCDPLAEALRVHVIHTHMHHSGYRKPYVFTAHIWDRLAPLSPTESLPSQPETPCPPHLHAQPHEHGFLGRAGGDTLLSPLLAFSLCITRTHVPNKNVRAALLRALIDPHLFSRVSSW